MRIEFAHSLADMAADGIHQFAVDSVFEHAGDRVMAQIVRTELMETREVT